LPDVTFKDWMQGQYRRAIDVPASRAALIVVDMQNAFIREEFSLNIATSQAPFMAAVPGCTLLVKAARHANVPVIYTRYAFLGQGDVQTLRGYRAEPVRGMILQPDTPDIEIIPELAPLPGDVVIDKSRPSAFYGTRLEPYLRAQGIDTIVICGVTTNICVETTARDAGQRDYNTFVVEDAVGEAEESRHWHSLYTVDFVFGTVCTVADVQRSWKSEVTGVPSYPLKRETSPIMASADAV
jgi:ureidoacrylate peracid hydrolase